MLRSELRDLQSSQKINNFILVIKTNLIVMDPQYSQTIFKYFQSQYLRSTSSRICYYYFLISNFNVNFSLDFPSFIRSNSVWRDKLQISVGLDCGQSVPCMALSKLPDRVYRSIMNTVRAH